MINVTSHQDLHYLPDWVFFLQELQFVIMDDPIKKSFKKIESHQNLKDVLGPMFY